MIYLKFYILCICYINIFVEGIEVQTTLGKVRGKLVDDKITGSFYFSFEGIPYAKPPVNDLRYQPPVLLAPWPDVFDATKPGYVCPQPELHYSNEQMNEDCLNFNIYAPANCIGKRLPVIFNIHGGDFHVLSGNAKPVYGPQLLLQQDVVVVTMNYRLGALGFLSFCTEEVSGNAGLKDLILLLKIISENIINFAGDPNNITLMGNGAGAAMAEYLMLTTECSGLFHKAILNSGSVLSPLYIQLNPRENAIALGKELGLNVSNIDCLIEELKCIDAFDIVAAQEALSQKDPLRGYRKSRPFKPTVEIENESAVLTRTPLELLIEGAIQDVPILIGFNDQEGVEIFRVLNEEPELIDLYNSNFELLVPTDIRYPYGSRSRKRLAARIRDFYFDGGEISFVNVQDYVNLMSHSQYGFQIDYFVKLFEEKKESPVYYYVFTADTELNYFKVLYNVTYPGAVHFDDIGYVFVTSVTTPLYKDLSIVAQRVQYNLLFNIQYFVYNGAPAPNPNTDCWPQAGVERHHLVQDYDSLAVFERPLPERIGFWYSVYEEYLNSGWNGEVGDLFCSADADILPKI